MPQVSSSFVNQLKKEEKEIKSEVHTAYPSGAPEFTPDFEMGLCCSVFSFLCSIFSIIVCPFVHFSFCHCIVCPSGDPYGIFKLSMLIFKTYFRRNNYLVT